VLHCTLKVTRQSIGGQSKQDLTRSFEDDKQILDVKRKRLEYQVLTVDRDKSYGEEQLGIGRVHKKWSVVDSNGVNQLIVM